MSNQPSNSLQFSIAVAALMVLTLAGCKGSSETPDTPEATPADTAEPATEAVEKPTEEAPEADPAASGGLSPALTAALEGIPAEQRTRAVPDDANPERGRQQFETTCGFCHGAGGKGDGAAAAALEPGPADWTEAERYGKTTAGEKAWLILHGVGGDSAMPGYSAAMSESQVWELVAFLDASFGAT